MWREISQIGFVALVLYVVWLLETTKNGIKQLNQSATDILALLENHIESQNLDNE